MSWCDLASAGKIPATTIESKERHAIPLRSGKLIPDGKPFAIKNGNRWRFVLGMEIDRGTEPLTTTRARRSIKEKFEHNRECFEDRRFATHYGFPNSIVLFVTTSETRMVAMMDLCRAVIGPCTYLLFAHTKDWANEARFPAPNGDMLGPYRRIGHPPLHLATFGES